MEKVLNTSEILLRYGMYMTREKDLTGRVTQKNPLYEQKFQVDTSTENFRRTDVAVSVRKKKT